MQSKRIFLFCGILALICSKPVHATDVTANAYTSWWSRYMWRGLRFSNRPTEQTNLALNYGALSASLWANYDFQTGKFTETDPTINGTWTWGNFGMNAGWTHFLIINGRDNDEVYLSATANQWFLTPTLTVNVDLDYGKGSYLQLNLTRALTLGSKTKLVLNSNTGFVIQDRYMGLNNDGKEFTAFFAQDIMASLQVSINEKLMIEPRVGYDFPISRQAKQAISTYGYGSESKTLYCALVMNYNF